MTISDEYEPIQVPSANHSPKVSIGLPVYNGENYLREAIDSILGQSFTDFELILSDNASSDKTADICLQYATKDSRVHYYRSKENLGASQNFNHVVHRAKGSYFKWAAHDDLCAPNYLKKCVDVLDHHNDVVLCHSLSCGIDASGKKIGIYTRDKGFDGPTPAERMSALINVNHLCVVIFGLVRRSALLETPLLQAYVGSDRNLLVELGLKGKLHVLDQVLFARRDHPDTSVKRFSSNESGWINWFDPNAEVELYLPTLKCAREYANSVNRVKMPDVYRAACVQVLEHWLRQGCDFKGRSVPHLLAAERQLLTSQRPTRD